jgi:hypothetical protein
MKFEVEQTVEQLMKNNELRCAMLDAGWSPPVPKDKCGHPHIYPNMMDGLFRCTQCRQIMDVKPSSETK